MKSILFSALLSVSLSIGCKAQSSTGVKVLFDTKTVESASYSYNYNALSGKIVSGGCFGNFSTPSTSYIEFSYIEKDSSRVTEGSKIDTLFGHAYRTTYIPNSGINNQLPYEAMQGLYSTDAATFYMTVYAVGAGNTRNGKPYPFHIKPLPEQAFILRAFNISVAEAQAIWAQIRTQIGE